MSTWLPKSIVDAERHRRTPRLLAISGGAMRLWVVGLGCGRFNVRRWQKLATVALNAKGLNARYSAKASDATT